MGMNVLRGISEHRAAAKELLAREDGRVRVKLCGMFRECDIDAVNECLPDLCGFIHSFPRSHRNIDLETMSHLRSRVDGRVLTVMVVVDLPAELAASSANLSGTDVIQLHGHEDNSYVRDLASRFTGPIIQACRIRGAKDVDRALASRADMVLLDAGQGSGETFDWALVERFSERRPYILAGGLGPLNVADAIRALRPWGVDMSSGIETGGHKDKDLMAAAVAAVRSAL